MSGLYQHLKNHPAETSLEDDEICATFRDLAFNTNYKTKNAPRFVLCSKKSMYIISYMVWESKGKPKYPRKMKKRIIGTRSIRRSNNGR